MLMIIEIFCLEIVVALKNLIKKNFQGDAIDQIILKGFPRK